MASPKTLALHLQQAATERPHAPALLHADGCQSFAELLDDSAWLAQLIADRPGPVIVGGDSFTLARHAYACSLNNQPFWPIENAPKEVPLGDALADVTLIISTSGSEGHPRAVRLGNAQLDAAAAGSNARLPLHPGDLWLNCLPLFHIGGQAILWRCARAGATLLLHDGFEAENVAADLASHPVSHISLVPAMLSRLLDVGAAPPASLRIALIGGAALSLPLYDRARAAGWPLYPSYGLTETAAQVATYDPTDGPWQPGLVGRPLPGHEVRIDADGRLQIRGPQVMRGDLNKSAVDADGWLTTGDLGQIDAAGCLSILGRADDMLISGGRNIHPQQVESCLAGCPGVHDVAVTGRLDPVWGDLVVALVVGPVAPTALLAHARRHLPSAALPRTIRHVDRLPRNAAGKLERAALRRLAAEAGS